MSLSRALAAAAILAAWIAVPAAAQPALSKVPPTGVRTCLGLTKEGWPTPQACADAGPLALVPKQDGRQGAGPLAYEAVPGQPRTACVRDRVSGLVWEGKRDNGRPADAMAYVAQVNASRLCGYADWRLPSVAELHGLVDLGKERVPEVRADRPLAEQSVIDARWFPHTVPAIYLTSDMRDPTSPWCVNFANGFVYDCDPDMSREPPLFVRLVRGPEAPKSGRWRELPDERGVPGGAVEDRHTGLVWRRCEEPQAWNGKRCTWSAKRYDYVQALQRAGEQAGWRLPTIKEIDSLARREADRFELPPSDFPAQGKEALRAGQWSSTVCNSSPETSTARASISAWVLSREGAIYCEARIMHLGVRFVRE